MPARKTRQYVTAAVESLTIAIELFNRPSPAGREHATVMMAAHAFEMLLKAAIYEERRKVQPRSAGVVGGSKWRMLL
jgi:HEPN domain-containing protein